MSCRTLKHCRLVPQTSIVDDELIHHPLQERQIPAAAAHALDLLVGQAAAAQVVAIGHIEVLDFRLGGLPIGLVNRAEAPLDAVGVVAARVHPQHHPRAGVHELAGDDDFIALPGRERAGLGRRLAAGKQGRRRRVSSGFGVGLGEIRTMVQTGLALVA